MSKSKQTPMMKQYNELKKQYSDAILFFRLGDFYEMFNEDAIEVSKVLEITLTSRNKNADNPIPMCGVPHHSAQQYIRTLIEEGYKVAICEQMEDPKLTKGMVKRDVVRIITPGTVTEEESLSSKENSFILSLKVISDKYYMAYADVSTAEVYVTESDDWSQIFSEMHTVQPKEIILDPSISDHISELIMRHMGSVISYYDNYQDFSQLWSHISLNDSELQVLNLLFSYIQSVQMQGLEYFNHVEKYALSDFLHMNYYTKQQLELTQSLRTQRKKGSLLWYLDHTKTAMGGRLLRKWLDKPLFHYKKLENRHNRVEILMNHYFERLDMIQSLSQVYDLERLITRISQATASVRDIIHLKESLSVIPRLNGILEILNQDNEMMTFDYLEEFQQLRQKIQDTLVENPPISASEGGIINKGVSEQLDTYLDALENGQEWLQQLQQDERERTGLKSLKVSYNKVFGYYIEISRLQAQNLNDDRYIRKQTLTNSERFITEELKVMEQTILQAQEKSKQLEYEIFVNLRNEIKDYQESLQELAQKVAQIDVLTSFAELSENEGFTRAELSEDVYDYQVQESFHPVVAHLIGESEFVPNDLQINQKHHLLLLTGPNMSGKSTYMRQIAYLVILNQVGCFIPAKFARLPLVDKIFTRIGSSDDISQGQSTFMVEMMETNVALRQATQRSLLLFDELGRGTATYDGMALAQGIIQYIHDHVKAVTIFSTHYHELTKLEVNLAHLKNIHVGATEETGHLVFLHKIIEGPADKSYGIHVAKLADLPVKLILDAHEILEKLEERSRWLENNHDEQTRTLENMQTLSEGTEGLSDVERNIMNVNVNKLTPLQALELIHLWQERLKS